MKEKLRFLDPPAEKTRPRSWTRDWIYITGVLEAHPMQWVSLDDGKPVKQSIANSIRQGDNHQIHPSRGFEIEQSQTNRTTSPPTCVVHLRYNPEKDQRKD